MFYKKLKEYLAIKYPKANTSISYSSAFGENATFVQCTMEDMTLSCGPALNNSTVSLIFTFGKEVIVYGLFLNTGEYVSSDPSKIYPEIVNIMQDIRYFGSNALDFILGD